MRSSNFLNLCENNQSKGSCDDITTCFTAKCKAKKRIIKLGIRLRDAYHRFDRGKLQRVFADDSNVKYY